VSASTHSACRQNNALAFVGLCTTQHWNAPVPRLIRLLPEALLNKTDSDVLPTSQIWEEVYTSKESVPDQLHLAWWAYPGGSNGCLTSDELEKALEQFLLQACHRVNFCIITTTMLNIEFFNLDRKCTIVGRSGDWLPLSEEN